MQDKTRTMKETQMLPVPAITRRRALLGAAVLSASLLAGAAPALGHPARHAAAFVQESRATER